MINPLLRGDPSLAVVVDSESLGMRKVLRHVELCVQFSVNMILFKDMYTDMYKVGSSLQCREIMNDREFNSLSIL